MNRWVVLSAALIATTSGVAGAQDVHYWPAPAVANGQMTYFPLGTPVMLRTRTQVSTKDNKPGDRVYLEVAETLFYHGQAVVPAGSVAVAEVARADRNGHFGRKGKLDLHLLYLETASGPVRLNGVASDEGTTGLYTSIATMAFVSPLGFLVHGTSAHVPVGTTVQAYLAEPLRFQETTPQLQASTGVQPDEVRPLPARFDPNWFASKGKQAVSR